MKLFTLTVLALLGLTTCIEANTFTFPEAAVKAVEGARRAAAVRARARVRVNNRNRGGNLRNRGRRAAVRIGLSLLGVNRYGYGGLAGVGLSSYDSYVEEAPVVIQQRTIVRSRAIGYDVGGCSVGAALGGCGSAALLRSGHLGSVRQRGFR